MSPKFLELLRLLTRERVDFIVVGGVAAILEGVPITTLDLDVVVDRKPENLSRLLAALQSIQARYRDPAGRTIEPSLDKLSNFRLHLLLTELGPLDVLGEIGEDVTYESLLPSTHCKQVGDLQVRVLGLARLIELKESADREKDRAMLPVLRRTFELKSRGD